MSTEFTLAKIFYYLFLSPLPFIVLFLIGSIFAARARWFLFGAAVLLFFLSSGFGVKVFVEPLEDSFRVREKLTFRPDAVVVLGGGANGYAPDSKLEPSAFKSFTEAFIFARKHNLPLVFTGGGWRGASGIIEGDAAKETAALFCDSLGFERPFTSSFYGGFGIIIEDKSENTEQNGKNTFLMMSQAGFKQPKIILVTSAIHMKRSKLIFEKSGFDVFCYAVDFASKPTKIDGYTWLPDYGRLSLTFSAIKEYVGMLKIFLDGK